MRYDCSDEKLLFVYSSEQLAGVGGISKDPLLADCLRLRRFYIRPHARGSGIGRKLFNELLKDVEPPRTITVHAGTPNAALFWDAIGFPRCDIAGITHIASLTADRRLAEAASM